MPPQRFFNRCGGIFVLKEKNVIKKSCHFLLNFGRRDKLLQLFLCFVRQLRSMVQ